MTGTATVLGESVVFQSALHSDGGVLYEGIRCDAPPLNLEHSKTLIGKDGVAVVGHPSGNVHPSINTSVADIEVHVEGEIVVPDSKNNSASEPLNDTASMSSAATIERETQQRDAVPPTTALVGDPEVATSAAEESRGLSQRPTLLERMRAAEELFRSPQTTTFRDLVKARDIKLEYHLHGNPEGKIKIVLIMGLLARKESWGLTVEALLRSSKEYHILTFDNRGIGNSEKPKGAYTMKEMAHDTIQLMKSLEWTSAHFVGVSMGGMIALEIGSRYPEYVRTLSLVVTTAGFPKMHLPGWMQLRGMTRASTSAFIHDNRKATTKLLRALYSKTFLNTQVEGAHGKTNSDLFADLHLNDTVAMKNSKGSALGQLVACLVHRVNHRRLHEIRDRNFPILIVSALKDKVIHPKCSKSLAKHLANGKMKFVAFEAGHAVHLERVDEVAEELNRHFATLVQ